MEKACLFGNNFLLKIVIYIYNYKLLIKCDERVLVGLWNRKNYHSFIRNDNKTKVYAQTWTHDLKYEELNQLLLI